ncbi:hypothetical protein L7Q18_30415, partial [Achromobacter xylosoxidans]|uniref:hypothetical protein n=1 Tax=Alcaligenes xylosoxydans xylosoxydans TaxID=85698 RepID=UPI001F06A381
RDARPVPEWWKRFGSDALNAMVEEGLANSPDLAAAERNLAGALVGGQPILERGCLSRGFVETRGQIGARRARPRPAQPCSCL